MASKKLTKSILSREAKEAIKVAKSRQKAILKAATIRKKQADKIYKEKVKELRPYLKKARDIDLRHNINNGTKSFITKAYQEFSEITVRPFQVYRSKNKKTLKVVQDASQQDTKIKFDVAFVPTLPGAKVKIRKGKVTLIHKGFSEDKILFNMVKLATDPKAELERIIRENKGSKAFQLMAGKYLWNGAMEPDLLIDKALNLFSRYETGGEGLKKRGANSHYTNWAFGVRSYKADTLEDVFKYVQEYHDKTVSIKRAKKSERRRRLRSYGKK